MTAPASNRVTWWMLGFGVLTCILRVPFLDVPFGPDEGYYAAAASRWLHGAALYADLGYVRPPLLNLIYATGELLAGLFGVPVDLLIRLLSGAAAAMTVSAVAYYLFFTIDTRAAATASAGAALMAASFSLENEANAETWMLLPTTIATLLVLTVLDSRGEPSGKRMMLAAGAFTAMGVLIKEVALVGLMLPACAWLVDERLRRQRWTALAIFFFGGFAACTGAWYLAAMFQGELGPHIYYTWLTRFFYATDSQLTLSTTQILRLRALTLGPAIFGIAVAAGVVFIAGRPWEAASTASRRAAVFAMLWCAITGAATAASGRYYAHYFIQMVTPLALLLGLSIDVVLRERRPGRRSTAVYRAVVTAVLLAGLTSGVSWLGDVRAAYAGVRSSRHLARDLATKIDSLTPRGSTFFVWGPMVNVRANATSTPFAPNVLWPYYPLGEPGGSSAFGTRFPSTGDTLMNAFESESPPHTVALTAPLHGISSSSMDAVDDPRVATYLAQLLTTGYTLTEETAGYALYIDNVVR